MIYWNYYTNQTLRILYGLTSKINKRICSIAHINGIVLKKKKSENHFFSNCFKEIISNFLNIMELLMLWQKSKLANDNMAHIGGQQSDLLAGGVVRSLPNMPHGLLSTNHTSKPPSDTWCRSFHPGDVIRLMVHLPRIHFIRHTTTDWLGQLFNFPGQSMPGSWTSFV